MLILAVSGGCQKQQFEENVFEPFNVLEKGEIELTVDFANSFKLNKDVFGVNSALPTKPYTYTHPSFIDKYIELGRPLIRFPGGTYANYYDFDTGYFIPYDGISEKNTIRINDWNSSVFKKKKEVGGYSNIDFCNFANQSGAEFTLVLNITAKNPDDTKRWMQEIKAVGQKAKYVEIGNELYFGNYDPVIPDITEYIKRAKPHADAVRSEFPDAKIGVIIPSHIYTHESFLDEIDTGKSTKQIDWMEKLPNENFYDAVIIHLYSSLGMANDISSTNEFIPYLDAYYNCLSHADNKLKEAFSRITQRFPSKEIWVTEYHVGGFSGLLRQFRLRHSYLGGLFASNFLLSLFNESQVTVGSWHSMTQLLDEPAGSGNSTPLIPDSYNFGTKVNYQFLKMFKDVVADGESFVPVSIRGLENYEVTGENAGTFPDVQSGLFFANEGGYAVVINKSKHTYKMGSSIIVNNNNTKSQLTILEQTILQPDQNIEISDAMVSETNFTKTVKTIKEEILITPYSVSLLKCKQKN